VVLTAIQIEENPMRSPTLREGKVDILAADTDQLTAGCTKRALRVVAEPSLHREAGDAEEELHFAGIVDVAVEVADVGW
jgi:hypothetical protein